MHVDDYCLAKTTYCTGGLDCCNGEYRKTQRRQKRGLFGQSEKRRGRETYNGTEIKGKNIFD